MSDGYTPYRTGHNYMRVNERERDEKHLAYREKYERWPELRRVADFPIHLDLELSSACNLRCPMCPTVYIAEPSFKRQSDSGAFMPPEMFRRAIDEGRRHADFCSVKLNYRGESTLHPKIVEMIAYARDAGVIDIMMNTNGNYPTSLNGEMVDAGLTWIAFSLDAARPETYRRCRAGGDFFTAYSTAIDMCRFVGRLTVQVGFVVQRANAGEVQEFKDFWSRMPVHRILVSDAYNSGGLIPNEEAILTKQYEPIDGFCCPQLWQRLVLWNDGRIFACCHAWDAPEDLHLGNIADTTLKEVWESEKLRALRLAHSGGRWRDVGACVGCPYPKRPVDPANGIETPRRPGHGRVELKHDGKAVVRSGTQAGGDGEMKLKDTPPLTNTVDPPSKPDVPGTCL
jgi:MoaA/NifB/PqqE/SkfB family radical SAM enzyme